jgi:hypothetical protein
LYILLAIVAHYICALIFLTTYLIAFLFVKTDITYVDAYL